MERIKRAGIFTVAAMTALFIGLPAAGATGGGPNCDEIGDVNIVPGHPHWDEDLDRDDDGVACEDPDAPHWTPPPTEPPAPPATEPPPVTEPPAPPATEPPPAPEPEAPAPPATPVTGEPDYTG